MSLNNEPCMINPTLVDLNPAKLNYYPFMAGIDKCNRSCNDADDLSVRLYFPIKIKCINATVIVPVITCLRGKFGITLWSTLF